MRFYGFGNYYLSSIQQGIQSLHVVSDISVKYGEISEQREAYNEWALNHKTVVLCNGGNSESLASLYDYFKELEEMGMNLPYSDFHEDGPSLNNALTAVGIIVEKRHYEHDIFFTGEGKDAEYVDFVSTKDFIQYVEKGIALGYEEWELNLMYEIKKYSLAK